MSQKKQKPEEIVAKLRDELLDGEVLSSLAEARIRTGQGSRR